MKTKTTSSAFKVALIYGQTIGAIAFFLGFALCIMGLTGSIELLFEGKGIQAKIYNATPGVIFAFFGFLIIWRYKPKNSHTITEKKIVHENGAPEDRKPKAVEQQKKAPTELETLSLGAMLAKASSNSNENQDLMKFLSQTEENRKKIEALKNQQIVSYIRTETKDSAMLSGR